MDISIDIPIIVINLTCAFDEDFVTNYNIVINYIFTGVQIII